MSSDAEISALDQTRIEALQSQMRTDRWLRWFLVGALLTFTIGTGAFVYDVVTPTTWEWAPEPTG